jgi:hypothetical protein
MAKFVPKNALPEENHLHFGPPNKPWIFSLDGFFGWKRNKEIYIYIYIYINSRFDGSINLRGAWL